MPSSNAKGARRERECIRELKERDWFPMKAPSSGSATDRELPDLIAGKHGKALAAEVKTANPENGRVYIDAGKGEDLHVFAKAFGMVPLFFLRWDQDTTWYWAEPSDVPVVEDSGNYTIAYADCRDSWDTLGGLDRLLSTPEAL